jgi:hypothetical protein
MLMLLLLYKKGSDCCDISLEFQITSKIIPHVPNKFQNLLQLESGVLSH